MALLLFPGFKISPIHNPQVFQTTDKSDRLLVVQSVEINGLAKPVVRRFKAVTIIRRQAGICHGLNRRKCGCRRDFQPPGAADHT